MRLYHPSLNDLQHFTDPQELKDSVQNILSKSSSNDSDLTWTAILSPRGNQLTIYSHSEIRAASPDWKTNIQKSLTPMAVTFLGGKLVQKARLSSSNCDAGFSTP
ncbi:hypothetical protein MHU86_18301 [Fragilaria crotonensis]|nr:hypothetical protein MHU86_18301 [Fragilaria crotonensis]